MLYLTLFICFISSILVTPLVKKLAFKIGATDKPNQRKVHQKIMPRLGGLAIFISFLIGYFLLQPTSPYALAIIIGSFIIIITGVLDDMMELSAKIKLGGQLLAALIVVVYGGVQVQYINLPFNGSLELGVLSIPLTIIWIVGITNAINLIDGLDGLAAGVSSIVLITISGMAIMMNDVFVTSMGFILLGSTLGFLLYNFHPAKIFMGDTGALFLGYMISVLSLLGFKNVTLISLIVPVIILGVPISDTFFAIIRRIVKNQPLSAPDKSHLHHCLLRLGYSHRQTVLIIYGMSAIFGLAAVIFSQVQTMWGSFLVLAILIFAIEIIVEKIGLVDKTYRPLLNMFQALRYK
ncbi:undecaprenyl/decaprenyl-phosphate alpha-N-acetylglucosaminyl 1-phosphate transferase [Priestia flexa]|jgi:UDP-GlcNAc:undecaprenyl-phosphate/decaprenyl-phosphate GlcNAc-1-phosphate transferase|uniref:Undecaprenyl/decaprenyl-phosphate alpha-N-acetylglucosaminyl 1-phosphate transferase n=1 Tax=Priestia flexa TaxID=86664 RepID=A0A8I1SNZ5_9BACI|nr:MraY family glycosyltransferase [Priestia flexa]MBN8252964.1 undecaprenyl/decaprenyl-phosphate alpha-N-acetylglucosaminyl 1-phosphate transferase [Priestia flexa]MBN8433606.1 undecaprenyl/decaprenyl-phosphate alpha-N-acetylglucosaminyl 1-phosphate transferase [Priestia flexa]MCA0966135.1 undecaprenyl/decaprenyl-phosphate alpha-N-acetylglucosaminyl 1-phosphate transferase [Priestia flexa]RIV07473.1 undecaprenyl/decaprenyl-phosphate alpha-N-acetylglucosaminyl 1-phosphate transferase [Priestia 